MSFHDGLSNRWPWLLTVDHVLRRTDSQHQPLVAPPKTTIIMMWLFGPIYGAIMGTYAWVAGERGVDVQWLQMLYSAIKVPLLLGATVLIALPSFFVINTLFGLRKDFGAVVYRIIATQAGLSIILVSLAPLTLFFYFCATGTHAYATSVIFNAGMFGVASISAQVLLRAYYRPLVQSNPKHRLMLQLWIFMYVFVGIQMAWIMRPFIGQPDETPQFFRPESWDNAYVRIGSTIWRILVSWFN
jgi:hypothetical protein